MKVCIVGAGPAGRSASGQIRQQDKEAEIDIFSTQSEIGYAPCEPPFVLRGVAGWDDIFYPGNFFEDRNITVHLKTEVTDIFREEKRIVAGGRSYSYDKLLLSPGAATSVPAIPGLDGYNEYTLSTNIADGRELEKVLPRHTSAAVIGAGAIGLEMMLTLVARGYSKVYLLVRRNILRTYLDDDMGKILEEVINRNGAEVVLPAGIESITTDSGKKRICLSDRELEVDFVFLATGARPRVGLARQAGIEIGETGGILVNRYLQTSDPDIYAAGDCIENWESITGSKIQHLMVLAAGKTGGIAGTNMVSGNSTPYEGTLRPFVIEVFGYQVGTVGYTERLAGEKGMDVVSSKSSGVAARERYGGKPVHCKLVADRESRTLIGAQLASEGMIRGMVNELTLVISERIPLHRLTEIETAYSPAVGIDPLAGAIAELMYKLGR